MVNITQQNGVVLIVSLVFLIALTTIASSLMLNTTIDIKISGVNQEKLIINQEAISVINEVIAQQVEAVNDENHFTHDETTYPYSVMLNRLNTQANIVLASNKSHNVNCSHSELPSSIDVVRCHHFIIEVSKSYGRNNHQRIMVKAGISQQVLNKVN